MQVQLTTTGARSGQPRPVTLYAWEDGDRLVIVASKGGSARNPAWVHNLRADHRATLARGTASVAVAASEVRDARERARLWRLVAAVDAALLGNDLRIDCAAIQTDPAAAGLNDVVACSSLVFGATVVDGYAAFGDRALELTHIGDPGFDIHPNDAGYALLAKAHRAP